MALVKVYISGSGGNVYQYEIPDDPEKAREHADQIIATGYRHNSGGDWMTFFPPHRIYKVVIADLKCPTNYPDTVTGT